MQIIQTTALITINETLVVVLISFLVFLFIMNRIMFRPLVRTMDQRQDHMERISQEIGALQQKVMEIQNRLAEKNVKVKTDARHHNEEAIRAGQSQAAELIADTRKQMAALMEESMRQVTTAMEKERREMAHESEAIAEAILEKVIGRNLK